MHMRPAKFGSSVNWTRLILSIFIFRTIMTPLLASKQAILMSVTIKGHLISTFSWLFVASITPHGFQEVNWFWNDFKGWSRIERSAIHVSCALLKRGKTFSNGHQKGHFSRTLEEKSTSIYHRLNNIWDQILNKFENDFSFRFSVHIKCVICDSVALPWNLNEWPL